MESQPPAPSGIPRSSTEAAVISVRGEAAMVVDPEVADLTFVVEAHARERREAFERLVKRNDEMLALLRSYGDSVERIESTGVAVAPELRRGRDEKIRSYSGTVRIRVAVADLSVLGELVARAADLEAVSIVGPVWRLRADSPVYRRARSEAVGEALTRARDYADALGCRVTGLIELADAGMAATPQSASVDFNLAHQASHGHYGTNGPAEQSVLDLEPRQQDVRAIVQARFHCSAPEFPIESA